MKKAQTFGVIFAGLSVLFGAFGAHGLKNFVSPELLQTFEVGVRYQTIHALGLILLGQSSVLDTKTIHRVFYCFGFGIFLFSGSLYLLVLTNCKELGAITPLGGVSLIAGWVFWLKGLIRHDA